jgi:hypothetical protein
MSRDIDDRQDVPGTISSSEVLRLTGEIDNVFPKPVANTPVPDQAPSAPPADPPGATPLIAFTGLPSDDASPKSAPLIPARAPRVPEAPVILGRMSEPPYQC